jgi:hypothetical protein
MDRAYPGHLCRHGSSLHVEELVANVGQDGTAGPKAFRERNSLRDLLKSLSHNGALQDQRGVYLALCDHT